MGICSSTFDKNEGNPNQPVVSSLRLVPPKQTNLSLSIGSIKEFKSPNRKITSSLIFSDRDRKLMKSTKHTKPLSISEFKLEHKHNRNDLSLIHI